MSCRLCVLIVKLLGFKKKKGRKVRMNLSPICAQHGLNLDASGWISPKLVLRLIPFVTHMQETTSACVKTPESL